MQTERLGSSIIRGAILRPASAEWICARGHVTRVGRKEVTPKARKLRGDTPNRFRVRGEIIAKRAVQLKVNIAGHKELAAARRFALRRKEQRVSNQSRRPG